MNYPNPHGPSCPWYPLAEATGSPNIKWCEETICAWISEPANTWSNVSYLLVAGFILWRSYKHGHNRLLKLFGLIVFIMGGLSFFYHLSNFYVTQILDFVGMFLLVGWTSGMNFIRAKKLKPERLLPYILAYNVLNIIVLHLMYLQGLKFQFLILIGAFLIIAGEMLASKTPKIKYHWFVTSLVLLTVALTFSIMDHAHVWCDPTQHGIFSQGHALWHWIGGLAMLAIYFHYSQPALRPQEYPGWVSAP